MSIRKVVAGFVVFSLVASAVPALAETPAGAAAPGELAAPAAPVADVAQQTGDAFWASLNHAVAASAGMPTGSTQATLHTLALPKRFAEGGAMANEEQVGVGGGGGSHLGLIIGLVSTVASLAATYIVIKQLKKTTTVPTTAP